jgi:hypothetical protein
MPQVPGPFIAFLGYALREKSPQCRWAELIVMETHFVATREGVSIPQSYHLFAGAKKGNGQRNPLYFGVKFDLNV